jgi:hypothetical protein
MIKKYKIFVLLILLINCKKDNIYCEYCNYKKSDELQIFNIILSKRLEIKKIEGGKIEYFLILNNDKIIKGYNDLYKDSIILKKLNIPYLPDNSVKELYKINPFKFKKSISLKVIYQDSLNKILLKNMDKYYNKDSICLRYERYFKNDYICIDYIYFNHEKSKAIVYFRSGKPLFESSSGYLFEKNKNIWTQKELLFY